MQTAVIKLAFMVFMIRIMMTSEIFLILIVTNKLIPLTEPEEPPVMVVAPDIVVQRVLLDRGLEL